MKFGLSMTILFREFNELWQKVERIDKVYLNLVDTLSKFSVEHGFKFIEIDSFGPFNSEVLNIIKDDIKERLKDFDEIVFHLPSWEINISAYEKAVREKSIEETKKNIKIAKYIGAKKLVLHPGSFGSSPYFYALFPEVVRKICKDSVNELISFSKKLGLEVCLENLPFGAPFFRKPDEFDYFIKKGVFLTLDTAHAITAGINPVVFIDRFQKKIKHVHLVDGFKGREDYHYAIGSGELNYTRFLNKLIDIGYEEIIILELMTRDDVIKSMNLLKDYL